MEPALFVLAIVVTVAFVAGRLAAAGLVAAAACWWSWAWPPRSSRACPTFELDPDLVLVGLLPPLLYAAAIRTSLIDFRAVRDALHPAGGRCWWR